jgi:signal transduction histidine kinase
MIADRKSYPVTGVIHLPSHTRDIEIDYVGLSFVAPQKVLFRYGLEGRDDTWQGTRRQAFYNDLRPGTYRFRVAARNNDGLWNEIGASLTFVIAPAFYQTIWFQVSCAMAFLASLWGLHRLRLYQLAREFNVRLEERVLVSTRLARDLHDTLLQSFQGVLLRFQSVSKLLPGGSAKEQLEKALERADQAIAEGRSAVYDLRSSATATNDLSEAVNSLGNELSGESAGAFHLSVEGSPRELRPIVRDELYRISREGLRNAFGHAQARNIEARISYGERELRLGMMAMAFRPTFWNMAAQDITVSPGFGNGHGKWARS